MAGNATIAKCPVCGYPLKTDVEGPTVCAYCQEPLEITRRISEGGVGFFPFFLGLALGVFLGPSLISISKGGRVWLEKTAREAEARFKTGGG